MAAPPSDHTPILSRPWIVAALVSAVIAVAVGAYLLLRPPAFAPLFTDMPLEASSAIIRELEANGTDYRLADGGRTILVPEADVNTARVNLAGAGGLVGGTDGFELFNESEMGLTEFAQRIKFLRALQGELARTIMAMDGIAEARVHLGMPERSVFRGDRIPPRAAVTVSTDSGGSPSAAAVVGIQQLVSAAVPDLRAQDVVVLNARGEPVSTAPVETVVAQRATASGTVSQPLAERLRDVVLQIAPGNAAALAADASEPPVDPAAGAAASGGLITVRLQTRDGLTQQQIQQASASMDIVARQAGYSGVRLTYVSPPLPDAPPPPVDDWTVAQAVQGVGAEIVRPGAEKAGTSDWLDSLIGPSVLPYGLGLIVILVVGLIGVAWWQSRPARAQSADAELDLRQAEELRRALRGSSWGGRHV